MGNSNGGSARSTVTTPERTKAAVNLNLVKEVLKKHERTDKDKGPVENGSVLKMAREHQGISQRALARKLGIQRTKLVRLEKRPWQDLTLGDLELLAAGLEVKWTELVERMNGCSKGDAFVRFSSKTPAFTFHFSEGVQLASLMKDPKTIFMGTLTLAPHQTLAKENSPRSSFLFYFVLEGAVLVHGTERECLLRAGEGFTVAESFPYELYNSHQFEPARLLVFASPSFIRSSA